MGLLDNRVSQDDIERVSDVRHHPQFESGFDGSGGDSDVSGFDDFGDLDDLFGGSDDSSSGGFGDTDNGFGGSSGFGDNNNGFGNNNNSGFGGNSNSFGGNNGFGGNNNGFGGNSNGFGGNSNGFGGNNGFGNNGFGNNSFGGNNNGFGNNGSAFGQPGFGTGFGGQNMMNQPGQQVEQKDTMDKVFDAGAAAAQGIGAILLEMIKSFKDRNADDYGYLSTNLIKTGAVLIPLGIIMGIGGSIADIGVISSSGVQFGLCGGLTLATGITGLGTAALVLTKKGEQEIGTLENVADEPAGEDNFTQDVEDNSGDIMDDIFGNDFDDIFNDDELEDFPSEPEQTVEEPAELIEPDPIDYSARLEEISENQYMSRQTLVNTFCTLFPQNTVKFADKKSIVVDSNDWKTLETICMKALANLANCTIEEVNSQLESAEETLFAYELRVKRINKVKKPDDLAKEIEIYMKDDENPNVAVTASISGDFYNIIISKGENPVVTFGDVFKLDYCKDFFLNEKNKLPMITGITDLGKVILDDAKNFDTMLIAGKPRSGKSWYVLSILMSLMLFNTPEDVMFIIVDPKESNLFKTMALMPHVCGLHNDKEILKILDDIIEVEAPRRKKLLVDNRCDDIWALRKKGIKLPVLYLVIDEYITVINNLDKDQQKEFDGKIQTLISQLPSQGIRLLFVPHRATGVVNKTNRTMLQFTAAVRADVEDVIDTLGIQKWTRALTKPGDIALKSSSMPTATFVKGAALTTDDAENAEFIENAAKVFYKMGVDIPDTSNMLVASNRNESEIQSLLGSSSNRVQYDASNILNDIDNMNLSDI